MSNEHERPAAGEGPIEEPRDEPIAVEPRGPVALALGSFIVITIVLRVAQPERESIGPDWLVPSIEIALLLALLAANPAELSHRRPWLRPLSIGLLTSLMVVTLVFGQIVIMLTLVGLLAKRGTA